MRFSVNCAFPHLGKRGATSRKSAVCNQRVTEKRILRVAPHGKAHSVRRISRKSALCMCRLTEKRILVVPPHGKAHSACERSRRLRLSVTVGPRGYPDCAFPSRHGHRMRLYVSVWGQSALFRKLRFSSPGQTRRRLTEKRILQPAGHGKAQSACALSRKSALCTSDLTEKRILRMRLTEKRTLRTRLTKRRTLHASGRALCRRAVTHTASTRTRNHATPDSPYPSTPSPTT